MLTYLPPELHSHIYDLLPKSSINQVSLACRSLYASALPTLYSTLVLSVKSHIRQLEAGLQDHNGFLYQVILHHTKELVLKCKQSGQCRLLFDIRPLLGHLPRLSRLTLMDFHTLPVSYIQPLLSSLPHLEQVALRYCDLVVNPSCPQVEAVVSSVTHLELLWTDFSKPAIDTLFAYFPSLVDVRLLANHNRHHMANNYAVGALQRQCPRVTHLDIGVQEVKEHTLVGCIAFYGLQLQALSLLCHSPATLLAITKYTPLVQDLTVRFSLETNWYPPPPPPESRSLPSPTTTSTTATGRQRQGRNDNHEEEEEKSKKGGLLCVLYHCQRLVRVQVESRYAPSSSASMDDNCLPPIISKALATVAQKRITLKNIQAIHHNVINSSSVIKQLALDRRGDTTGLATVKDTGNEMAKQDEKAALLRATDHQEPRSSSPTNDWVPKRSFPPRPETILVLDDEQLKEIRSQASPQM